MHSKNLFTKLKFDKLKEINVNVFYT